MTPIPNIPSIVFPSGGTVIESKKKRPEDDFFY
jgi:hypothetical protein